MSGEEKERRKETKNLNYEMESSWLSFGFEKTCDKCTFILYRVTQIKIKHFWPHVGKAKMSLRHNKQTAGKGK